MLSNINIINISVVYFLSAVISTLKTLQIMCSSHGTLFVSNCVVSTIPYTAHNTHFPTAYLTISPDVHLLQVQICFCKS
jgi:hypothetical protein